MNRVLYHVVSGAGSAVDVEALVRAAVEAGWRVRMIATPSGAELLDVPRLEALTGAPVRTRFRTPSETSNGLPPPDAVLVAPATFNTVNKWALGITDTVAVGMLCDLVGSDVPMLVVPQVKAVLARHVAFVHNLEALRSMGVRVMFDPSSARPPSWEDVLVELDRAAARP